MKTFSALLLAVALVACGGSDPLASVDNCTDLATAVQANDLSDRADEVEALADEMTGKAIANGAELEAAICIEAAGVVYGERVRETFEEIGTGLD